MPHCVGISCVRDESDIIELSVRYNLRLLDELHVIDNLSADRTRWVLQQLKDEGLPVHIHASDDPTHQQEKLVSQLARELVARSEVGFVVPLDADELLAVPSRDEFHAALATIPRDAAGAMFWRSFLPEPGAGSEQAFFRRMTRFRSLEARDLPKLILRGEHCRVYSWSPGCHNAFHDETQQPIPRVDMPFRLAHFPVRDAAQLARKVLIGAHALSIKQDTVKGEGWHWKDYARQLREADYKAEALDLEKIALSYALLPKFIPQQQVLHGAIPDFPEVQQRYPVEHLSLLAVMDKCLEHAAQEIQSRPRVLPGFTQDWFSHHIPNWTYLLTGLNDVPDARFLEIGSYEGRSTVWLLTHALKRPDARIYCVDTFQGGVEHTGMGTADLLLRFRANVAPWKHKVVECIGDSAQVLPRLQERFDAVYIDGSHVALDCLRDAVHSWSLLKPGGVMIFDDYGWKEYTDPAMLPKTAIDGFLACVAGRYRLLGKGYQVAIQKL